MPVPYRLMVEYFGPPPAPGLERRLAEEWAAHGIALSLLVQPRAVAPAVEIDTRCELAPALPEPRGAAVAILRCRAVGVDGEPRATLALDDDHRAPVGSRNAVLAATDDPEAIALAVARVVIGWPDLGAPGDGRAAPPLDAAHRLRARDRVRFRLQEPPRAARGRILWLAANPFMDPPAGPYGLEILSHVARGHGFDDRIVNPFVELVDPAEGLRALIERFDPHLIGLSLRNLDDALIVKTTREGSDAAVDVHDMLASARDLVAALAGFTGPVLVGGSGFSCAPQLLLADLGLEWGCVGTGEEAVDALCRSWHPAGEPDGGRESFARLASELPGVVRRGAAVRAPAGRARELAQPAVFQRHLPNVLLSQLLERPQAVRGVSGCPIGCSYCLDAVNQRHLRSRGAAEVVDEMEFAYEHYGTTSFHLADPEANLPFSRLTALAEEILRRDLAGRIKWTAYLNVRPFDADSLPLLLRSGMCRLKFAVDHFHDAVIAGYGKNYRERDVLELLERLAPYVSATKVMLSILFGGPGETEETLAHAIARIRGFSRRGFVFYYNAGVRVYPGTPLEALAARPEAADHLYGPGRDAGPTRPLVYCAPCPPRELARRLEEVFASDPNVFRMNLEIALPPDGYRLFLVAWHRWLDGRPEEARALLERIGPLDGCREARALRDRLLSGDPAHRAAAPEGSRSMVPPVA